jgi:hypothetical protein
MFGFCCSQCIPSNGFQHVLQNSQSVPQHAPNSNSPHPIFFAQHCPLGTYIGEEPIWGLSCSYVWTSVERFSNVDPVLEPVLTVWIDWHFLIWEPGWKPTSGSHMIENREGSLTELRSGSQSSLYHLLVPLVLLLTWDCYSSPVAVTVFLRLLLLFSHYYFSLFITILFTAITVLPLSLFSLYWYYCSLYYYYFFLIALILFLLLWLFSHGVALFLWRSHLIIKTDFN